MTLVQVIDLESFGLHGSIALTLDPISQEFIVANALTETFYACHPNGPFMAITPFSSGPYSIDVSDLTFDPRQEAYLTTVNGEWSGSGFDMITAFDRVARIPSEYVELNLFSTVDQSDDTAEPSGLAMDPNSGRLYVSACVGAPSVDYHICDTLTGQNMGIWEITAGGDAIHNVIRYDALLAQGALMGYYGAIEVHPITGEIVITSQGRQLWAIHPDTHKIRMLYDLNAIVFDSLIGLAFSGTGDLAILAGRPYGESGEEIRLMDADGDGQFTW